MSLRKQVQFIRGDLLILVTARLFTRHINAASQNRILARESSFEMNFVQELDSAYRGRHQALKPALDHHSSVGNHKHARRSSAPDDDTKIQGWNTLEM